MTLRDRLARAAILDARGVPPAERRYGGWTFWRHFDLDRHYPYSEGQKLAQAMIDVAHACVVPDAGDGHPGILVQKRHSDFVSCPVCDALYEWGSTEPKSWVKNPGQKEPNGARGDS